MNEKSLAGMRHLSLFVLLAASFAVSPPVCEAQAVPKSKTLPIGSLIVDQTTQEVTVVFNSRVPSSRSLEDPTKWTVIVYVRGMPPIVYQGSGAHEWTVTSNNAAKSVTPEIVQVDKNRGYVILTLPPAALTGSLTSLLVSFDSGPLFAYSATPAGKFSAATSKSTSDNYISATYSPAFHSAAQYNIDAKGSFIHQWDVFGLLSELQRKPYFGAIATVETDNRPTADPDSFLVSGLVEWVLRDKRFFYQRAQGILVNWNVAGLEFDRQTTTKTFISSPIAEIPIRLSPVPKPGSHFFLGMFPYFGIETGTNLSNAINSGGSGFLLRGVLGTSISVTEKTKWKYLSQIGVSANYTARIPTTNEIFTNVHYISATGKTVSLPVMSSQVRNHVSDELDFTIAKPFSISVKHEYGELPPGFRTVDNKVTIGLTVMLQQNNTPQSNVNKNLTPP